MTPQSDPAASPPRAMEAVSFLPNSLRRQAVAPRAKNSTKQTIGDRNPRMTNDLQGAAAIDPTGARAKRRHRGWTPERRARQAALIRFWAPWRRSTGPKTEAGKARCAANAVKHGFRSQPRIRQLQRVRHALRLAARNIELLRLLIRIRDSRLPRRSCYAAKAGPRIKYKFPPPGARASLLACDLLARFEQLSSPVTGRSARRTGEGNVTGPW